MTSTENLFNNGIADTREHPNGRSDTRNGYQKIAELQKLRNQVRTPEEYDAITKEIGTLFRGIQEAIESQGQLNILNIDNGGNGRKPK